VTWEVKVCGVRVEVQFSSPWLCICDCRCRRERVGSLVERIAAVGLDLDQPCDDSGRVSGIQQLHCMCEELTRRVAVQREGEICSPEIKKGGK
jgi:hypothetical protein